MLKPRLVAVLHCTQEGMPCLGPCMASTVCGRNDCETYLFLRVALYCSQTARPTKRAASTSFRYRPLYFRRELAVLCRELESCTIFFVSPPPLLCCIARKERLPGFDFGLSPPSPDETEGKRAWYLHHQAFLPSSLGWLLYSATLLYGLL